MFLDLLQIMVPENYLEFINSLTLLVKSNVIPMTRINDAVRRILRVKFVMGLFEDPLADPSLAKHLGSQEHRELAREAVRKSLVLLKNGKGPNSLLLPLPKKSPKILVAGSHADNLGFQCGGWTIEWQGVHGNDLTEGKLGVCLRFRDAMITKRNTNLLRFQNMHTYIYVGLTM